MRISVHAVGRMKSGPERELADRYFDRLAKAGPAVGIEFGGVIEIPESRARNAEARKREEAAALEAHLADGAIFYILDERGKSLSSEEFANDLGRLRDAGERSLVVAIGGADGHDAELRSRARRVISLGAMTWPHQIVRILIAEQLYRAVTILSGHPYHRG